jgi:3-phosphoshikimate 1-carboxyvinyltransferase
MRLLAGLFAGQPMVTELTGDASLRSRPMGRIKEPLERMGARLELLGEGGRAPVRITGGRLRGIDYAMPVASAQVKSCILLAGLFAEGTTVVREPLPTRDHTERLFQALGIPLKLEGGRITLAGYGPAGPALAGRDWQVPGDFSSAAFWLVAAAAGHGGRITLQNVGLNPRRTALLEVLRRMGARLAVSESRSDTEPCGEVSVSGGKLKGTRVAGAEIPDLIDELPIVAVAGALAEGATEIRDARELRVKESDRIAAMAANLRAMGVTVTEYEDGLAVQGGARLRGGVTLDSQGDHRIAMAMAILALFAEAPVTIVPVACVDTSYPEFWKHLEELGGHVSLNRSR